MQTFLNWPKHLNYFLSSAEISTSHNDVCVCMCVAINASHLCYLVSFEKEMWCVPVDSGKRWPWWTRSQGRRKCGCLPQQGLLWLGITPLHTPCGLRAPLAGTCAWSVKLSAQRGKTVMSKIHVSLSFKNCKTDYLCVQNYFTIAFLRRFHNYQRIQL